MQGGSVAKALIKSGKYRIELVKCDQANYHDLTKAFEGAYGVFALTDFYSVGLREEELGTSMASAAKEAGVQHFIWSTLVNCEEKSGGKYKVPHLSGKARVDPVVRALGFKHHTFIVLAFYFQNFVDAGFSRVDADGAVVFDLPMEAQHILQACDVHDTGAAVLAAFQDPQAWQEEEYMNLCGFHGLVQTYLDLFTKSTGHRARLNTLAEIKDEKVGKEWTDCNRQAEPLLLCLCLVGGNSA
eukprot:jgi/Mesen1/7487/ME000039S06707